MRRLIGILLCGALALSLAGAGTPKYVVLTFDDGPTGSVTAKLLEGLAERNARATFFLCGYRMKDFPDMAEKILAGGHEIGCHGYSHKNMQMLSRRDIAGEISDMEALLPEGTPVHFLRPPGGCCGENVMQVAQAKGMPILEWSVDPRDWETHDSETVVQRILGRVKDGDVILMHDMTESSVDAALQVVDNLQRHGYHFVTVSELIMLRDYTLRPGKIYRAFPERKES